MPGLTNTPPAGYSDESKALIRAVIAAVLFLLAWILVFWVPWARADWELILAFTKVLVWPLLIIVVVLLFRKAIPSLTFHLLSRTKKVTTPFAQLELVEPLVEQSPPGANAAPPIPETGESPAALSVERELEFSQIYIAIYGSQILLLDALNQMAAIPYLNISEFFEGVKLQYPNFNYGDLSNYLNYLIGVGLISADGQGNYRITDKGRQFLLHVTMHRYQKNKGL